MTEFINSYFNTLDEQFYQLQQPKSSVAPQLIKYNKSLAEQLGIDSETSEQTLTDWFSGNEIIPGGKPIALAYAGHQFGNFVPQLGDGRAVLLGDVLAADGKRYDIQLKGSGQTPFSRAGDGRSALGPVIREYILSEAMFHLGVPTTRALAAVTTGEQVYREYPTPGGVFTRVSRGHVRIGSFEYFAARQQPEQLKQLADYCIERFYPDVKDNANPYLSFFESVAYNILSLVAQWQGLGFIHGVMNTDNMSIVGETIDYGPCAFMDSYTADKVFSSIDTQGRYAYNQQANIALWNLSILASCLVPVVAEHSDQALEELQSLMNSLAGYHQQQWLKVFRSKLGLFNEEPEDHLLIEQFLIGLETEQKDFSLAFRALNTSRTDAHNERLERQEQSVEQAIQLMNDSNPYLIPRNHQVEEAIEKANKGDFGHFNYLMSAYLEPFKENSEFEQLTQAPLAFEEVKQTFCGT